MPVIILERIPLPSLRTYTSFSVLLLSCAVFYAYQCVRTFETDPPNPANVNIGETHTENNVGNIDTTELLNDPDVAREPIPNHDFDIHLPYENFWWNVFFVLTSEVWCIWVGNFYGIPDDLSLHLHVPVPGSICPQMI